MKKYFVKASLILVSLLVLGLSQAVASDSVKITSPHDGEEVHSPFKVCLETHGVEVEPAKKGVNKGKGHHHLLVDVDLPGDLSKPIAKDKNHVHMGNGADCKELKLDAGEHTIKALFATGNHVPYDPAITDSITVNVK